MSQYYCGIDLHTRNSQLCVTDEKGNRVKETKLPNDLSQILGFLHPFGEDVQIGIESTINWYWIVDGLQDAGYDVKLGHTLGLFMITGAKVKTDRRDAFKLAKYLRLEEFPEAYIYPKEKRPLRDLLRRRTGLVEVRASCYRSLRVQLMRYNLNIYTLTQLKNLEEEDFSHLPIPEELDLYCRMLLERINLLSDQIQQLDAYLKTHTLDDPSFKLLLGLPGVWYTLGLTIYYESGDISRFDTAKQYASYSRLVPALSRSDQTTKKGKGAKQGNRYLKWAFTQAASIAVRYYPKCRKFRDKHERRRNHLNARKMLANCILAHKLSTATYHVLKNGVPFDIKKSDTSGRAGGLKNREPLEAVENRGPPKGGYSSNNSICSSLRSASSCSWMYLRTDSSSLPTVET